MTRRAGILRAAALAAHVLLLLALPAWLGLTGALLDVPLLLALPGLWRRRAYTYQWASLLILPYLGGFLMEAFAGPQSRYPALLLAAVAVVEFCALVLHSKINGVRPH